MDMKRNEALLSWHETCQSLPFKFSCNIDKSWCTTLYSKTSRPLDLWHLQCLCHFMSRNMEMMKILQRRMKRNILKCFVVSQTKSRKHVKTFCTHLIIWMLRRYQWLAKKGHPARSCERWLQFERPLWEHQWFVWSVFVWTNSDIFEVICLKSFWCLSLEVFFDPFRHSVLARLCSGLETSINVLSGW